MKKTHIALHNAKKIVGNTRNVRVPLLFN